MYRMDMDECMNLVCKENFDIVIVGLDFSGKKWTTFIQRLRTLISISFNSILAGGIQLNLIYAFFYKISCDSWPVSPLTYEGFSEKYKQLLNYEMNLSVKGISSLESQELYEKGELDKAAEYFEKAENTNPSEDLDLYQSLIGTDLYLMKGDKNSAKRQLLFFKSNAEKSPTYQPVYEHREHAVNLMTIKAEIADQKASTAVTAHQAKVGSVGRRKGSR